MSWKRLWLLPVVYLLLVEEALAQEYKTETGEVVFLSSASLNEFTGESGKLNGLLDLASKTFDFYIDLNTLETGIGLRDRHMRENYLETNKYPFAEFSGKLEKSGPLKLNQAVMVKAVGTFKIHGQEKDRIISGKLTKISASEVLLEADFQVKLGDFDIAIPQLMFYELSEIQQVTIKAALKNE
ncbi:YceI family protein [Cyclobacterium jeungdonense]|uniref:YceI family protein n=1 Tax=Cyclobacterium jeungdonense TaxID=708087 RepID=A0ABT8CB85_9BACT|nr:YceI family protein [Cyclobacterium jeungdonense]MDN3688936.1 YceI family protein [Cyclobacterium jeungdonense]